MTRSDSKLGIWITALSRDPRRIVVRVTVASQAGRASFMALTPGWATIPSRIRETLNISHGQELSVLGFKEVEPHHPKTFRTENGKADMLSLIPSATSNGYPLYVDEYETAGENWLSIWYHHPRGAARQIELKRYVDITRLGQLLGQLQAEGEKTRCRVVFKNSSIPEHTDFISCLLELGVPSGSIRGRCVFNPTKSSPEAAYEYAEQYRNSTGITIRHFNESGTMKGAIAADTIVRSSTLATVLLFAMNGVRRGIFRDELLRRNFLAKLLSGDGSLGPRKTPKRLDIRLTIVDRDVEALRDYAEILSEEGFKARVNVDRITVRAYCTWLNILRLYEIGAFKNGKNWVRLLCSIKISMLGRENRGYKRIQELSKCDSITSDYVLAKYGVGRRAANLWIQTMHRKGLMETLPTIRYGGRKSYVVSARGKKISGILEGVERDYKEIAVQRGIDDAETLLRQIKQKVSPAESSAEVVTSAAFGQNNLELERLG